MSDFSKAFEKTMKFEDEGLTGKVTVDAGGRTRFGIAEKFHPDLQDAFFTQPAEDALAEAEQMMRGAYWDKLNLSEVQDQDVADKIFDMAVNMGTHQAAVMVQRAVNFCISNDALKVIDSEDYSTPLVAVFPLLEDGVIGVKTIAQINMTDVAALLKMLRELSESLYRHIATNNPAQAVNLEGWLKRAAA